MYTKNNMFWSFALFLFILQGANANCVATSSCKGHVVFVHGLAGWGPTELLGINYWGFPGININIPILDWLLGLQPWTGTDYKQYFRNAGYSVHEAAVGPVSSNHDRACELYAQIMGTVVDYGQAHSTFYGHNRYQRNYTGKGFVPNWNGNKKIHFIGHSMGGMTIRYLEYLLHNGNITEVQNGNSQGPVSPLFVNSSRVGGNNWIASITTISTPHDGSSLHTKIYTFGHTYSYSGITVGSIATLLQAVIAGVAAVIDSNTFGTLFYDFKLDQFGVAQLNLQTQNLLTYMNGLVTSTVWQTSDLASWDLSPQWAMQFNAKTQLAYPGTAYFAFSTYTTQYNYANGCCSNGYSYNFLGLCNGEQSTYPLADATGTQGDCSGTCSTSTPPPNTSGGNWDQVYNSATEPLMVLTAEMIGRLEDLKTPTSSPVGFTLQDSQVVGSTQYIYPVTTSPTVPYSGCNPAGTTFDSYGNNQAVNWEMNDGLVPIVSSRSPRIGIKNYVSPVKMQSVSAFQNSTWYYQDVGRDHTQAIGFDLSLMYGSDPAGTPGTFNPTLGGSGTVSAGIYGVALNNMAQVGGNLPV